MKSEQTTSNKSSLLSSEPGSPLIIAGPCSAETEEQVLETARRIKSRNIAHVYRAGIWKPRTRPNSFEGVGKEGLGWLQKVKQETGMLVATEVANARHVAEALAYGIDILWIGARTSVNPFSVQEIADSLAGTNVTVLVKNPINPDFALWIGAIERLAQAGIKDLGAIHRGFSTDTTIAYRNTPKWNLALNFKKEMPEIPLLCDPSHIGGRRDVLKQLSQKALDLGMDGLMIESHIDPDKAWSDAKQQITPEVLGDMLHQLYMRERKDLKEEQELLDDLSQEISSLDHELFNLLSQRARVFGKLGFSNLSDTHKTAHTQQLQESLGSLIQKAKTEGLEESYIQSVFAQVHAYASRV
ncbi:bifunctional 3-deoxy-7-phosphoheptulonate synthase/chorismate mutase type II [Cesiribacter sp. SM1]|uniref:bifunctional 3-deoxy-7-phosphoheptulonate synthase/chorismate mutase type II n=1 Tax=Cesiribacter sp. SM1 TaxID=2861196 RepID=UPI001CD712E8|nr:bifunctional 3-deoxy-7-phosphoheptulonate synthase/chorismate mutase type II [Cesiribacter sp. SM1]